MGEFAADNLKRHPLSACFPELADDAFGDFAADIEASGQREAIVIFEGRILDGWHRYRACQMLGKECRAKDWPGDLVTAGAYVLSKNLHRRSLTETQRALALVMVRSVVADNGVEYAVTAAEIADETGVSERTAYRAKAAAREGRGPAVMAGAPAVKPKSGSPRPVNPPMVQPIEHVDAEKAQLQAEIERLKTIVEDLVDELQAIGTVKAEEEEQKDQIKALHATIRMLENTRDQLYDDKNALNRQIKGLTSKLQRAGL